MNLNRHRFFRNALYTMMARSFLESHLVIGNADPVLVEKISQGLDFLSKNNAMNLRIPHPEEIANQEKYIVLEEPDSIEGIVRQFCAERSASPRLIAKLISRMEEILGDTDFDREYIDGLLVLEYDRHRAL